MVSDTAKDFLQQLLSSSALAGGTAVAPPMAVCPRAGWYGRGTSHPGVHLLLVLHRCYAQLQTLTIRIACAWSYKNRISEFSGRASFHQLSQLHCIPTTTNTCSCTCSNAALHTHTSLCDNHYHMQHCYRYSKYI